MAPGLPSRSLGNRVPTWRIRRHPLLFWVAAGTLSLVTGITVTQVLGRAEVEASRFGDMRPVLVATKDVPAGNILGPNNTEVRSHPSALVPKDALHSAVDGVVVSADIKHGEAVLNARLAPGGLSTTASLIPPGGRAIAVPTGVGSLALERGDRLDVLATLNTPTSATGPPTTDAAAPTFPIARNAVVIAVNEENVTLALTEEEAARVAYALTAGVVTLVLNGA